MRAVTTGARLLERATVTRSSTLAWATAGLVTGERTGSGTCGGGGKEGERAHRGAPGTPPHHAPLSSPPLPRPIPSPPCPAARRYGADASAEGGHAYGESAETGGYDQSTGYWGEDGHWVDTSGGGQPPYAVEYGADPAIDPSSATDDANGRGALVLAGRSVGATTGAEVEPEPEGSAIMVTIHSCAGLRKADLIGKSDPFVVVNVLDKEVARTSVIDNTQDPEWPNASFRVPLDLAPRDLLDDVTVQVSGRSES